ncbi:MAG TPA: SDR family oxidoreductase [Burkholderiales bacterium]|nr:SDR family oxidoreductase [Burkholderiales bacterium]
MRLKGKVAIVAGGGASGPVLGNGQATAVLFAREGAKVVVADAALERAQATVDTIAKEGGTACAVRADVSKAADCKGMVQAAVERYGRLDILDNNVGISVRADVLEVTEEQWDRVMAVNVKSIVLAAKYAIPEMKKAGGGSIINISSVAGLRANQSTPYTTSKAAIVGLTRSMAGDHGRDGIRVNCILPGLIYGPMTAPRMDEEIRRKRREAGALGTEGTGWDVAWAAVFLASDEARWITGVALPVDAGFLVMSPTTGVRLAQQKY